MLNNAEDFGTECLIYYVDLITIYLQKLPKYTY